MDPQVEEHVKAVVAQHLADLKPELAKLVAEVKAEKTLIDAWVLKNPLLAFRVGIFGGVIFGGVVVNIVLHFL